MILNSLTSIVEFEGAEVTYYRVLPIFMLIQLNLLKFNSVRAYFQGKKMFLRIGNLENNSNIIMLLLFHIKSFLVCKNVIKQILRFQMIMVNKSLHLIITIFRAILNQIKLISIKWNNVTTVTKLRVKINSAPSNSRSEVTLTLNW